MSEHSSDSISNRLAQPGKNASQKKHITRFEGHINIDQLCDRENLPTDLQESWPYKEPLHNKSRLINYGDKIITVMYQYTHKELYILSEPSEGKENYPLQAKRFAREPKWEKQTLVQHRQNRTWEPATVVSQCTTNSYWIMQENGTEQPKVYRRTRSMLKIRSTPTEAEQTGYRNSQLTEPEKAEFHTPAIPNTVRDCVQENPLENISPDLVQMTLPTSDTYPQASAAAFDSKSKEREEIADTSAPALEMAKEQGTYTPGSRKSTRKNFGKPASTFSDFYM